MSVPVPVLADAFDEVLPDDREDMDREERAQWLLDHKQNVDETLRDMGHEVTKSGPEQLLEGFYDGSAPETTMVDSSTAEAVEKRFSREGVDPDHASKPPLSHFYGDTQPSSPGSSRGDYRPDDG